MSISGSRTKRTQQLFNHPLTQASTCSGPLTRSSAPWTDLSNFGGMGVLGMMVAGHEYWIAENSGRGSVVLVQSTLRNDILP